jgi:hypothetical protein
MVQTATKALNSIGELLDPPSINVGGTSPVQGPVQTSTLANLSEDLVGDATGRGDLTPYGKRVRSTSPACQSSIPLDGDDGTAISREGILPAK